MKKAGLTPAIVLLLIAAAILPSCDSAAAPAAQDTAPISSPVVSETEADTSEEAAEAAAFEKAVSSLPDRDYNGYEFKIMGRSVEYDAVWASYDIYAEKENGEPINDAVYQRNLLLEEAFNIKFVDMSVGNPYETMWRLITAGDDAVDTFTDGMVVLNWMASANMLYNMNNIEELKLDKPWWDQQMRNNMNILDKLYIMTGDISIMDNEGTWCMLFNKQMYKDFDFDDPYQTVKDGKWTLDKMLGMMKEVANDTNGDGVRDINDRWGFVSEPYNVYALWNGAGNMIGSLDSSDQPVITMFTERAVSTYDKVLSMQFDNRLTGVVGTAPFISYADLVTSFTGGNALYVYGAMGLISDFRSSDTDFGVLPAPKFDEQQENYCTPFQCWNMTAYAIPNTAQDPARTGTIMEAMAEISQYTLTPAYYDITLKTKSVRDVESEEMIDLVLNTRSYDIGQIHQWSGCFDIFQNATHDKIGTFVSQYQKVEKGMLSEIKTFMKNIEKND
ncbi:MAG: hypothetical protein MJ175_02830 [Clostridia bacterium]|nr:hypothetical protein [Clostridia bacterium]